MKNISKRNRITRHVKKKSKITKSVSIFSIWILSFVCSIFHYGLTPLAPNGIGAKQSFKKTKAKNAQMQGGDKGTGNRDMNVIVPIF
jgi:hypothetical protein